MRKGKLVPRNTPRRYASGDPGSNPREKWRVMLIESSPGENRVGANVLKIQEGVSCSRKGYYSPLYCAHSQVKASQSNKMMKAKRGIA
jgi:hypothetical protein